MPITKPETPVRNHIQASDIKYWCKHWNVEWANLEAAIEKAGTAVSAVRKELIARGVISDPSTEAGSVNKRLPVKSERP